MKKTLFTLSIVFAGAFAALLTHNAIADPDIAFIRQADAKEMVHIRGDLQCKMAPVNIGLPCDLKITDAESGRTFKLEGAQYARKLFYEGKRNVSVSGKLKANQTLRVVDVKAL